MPVAYDIGTATLNSSFATSVSTAAITAAATANRCALAWGTCESDNTVTISNLKWGSTGLNLGADHDPSPLPFAHSKYGTLQGSTVASGSNSFTVTDNNGNAKPRVIGAIYNGVASVQNQAYLDANSNTPTFTISGSAGDTAAILVITDGAAAVSCTSGGTIRASGTSGAYQWFIIDQAIVIATAAIVLLTTGPTASWAGMGASLTPSAAAGFVSAWAAGANVVIQPGARNA